MTGNHITNNALEASIYESKICSFSELDRPATFGTLRIVAKIPDFRSEGSGGFAELSDFFNAWEKTAEHMASPNEPPIARRKLRVLMTTARSRLAEWACRATRLGWKVKPTPAPSMIRKTAICQRGVDLLKSSNKPLPKVHNVYPIQITSPYRFVRDMYWPEPIENMDSP